MSLVRKNIQIQINIDEKMQWRACYEYVIQLIAVHSHLQAWHLHKLMILAIKQT